MMSMRDGQTQRQRPDALFSLFLAALLAQPAVVPASAEGFPFTDETLNYSLNFSTGFSIGKAHMIAATRPDPRMELQLFAGRLASRLTPSSTVSTLFADSDLCSLRFERSSEHGKRKAHEVTWFDRTRSVAVRATKDAGGLTEIPVGLCPHDALTFLYYLRRELGQGRMPPNDVVLAGAQYHVSMVYVGEKSIVLNKQQVVADQINFAVKGPASDVHLEIVFARDAARTPLVIRCPLTVGNFSLELVR